MKAVIRFKKENSDMLVLEQLKKESAALKEEIGAPLSIHTMVKDGVFTHQLQGEKMENGKKVAFTKTLAQEQYQELLTSALEEMHYQVDFIVTNGTCPEDLTYFANVRSVLYEKRVASSKRKALVKAR